MNNLDQLYNEWQQLQPLKSEDKKRLDDKFNLEYNFNSNHIENNTLTYGQTKLLLVFGESTGDAKMRDLEEMKAHNAGLQFIRELANNQYYTISEYDIKQLNRIILIEDYYRLNPKHTSNVGEYKINSNSVITVTGEEFSYASPSETPTMMEEFVKWLKLELKQTKFSPIELATLAHYRYVRIHPFDDGNGRIARLLVTYILLHYNYPMIIIKSEHKNEYLRLLHQCDIASGINPTDGVKATIIHIQPFLDYMQRQLQWSLQTCIRAAHGENIEEDDDWRKRLKTRFMSNLSAPILNEQYKKTVRDQYLNSFLKNIDNELSEYYCIFDRAEWNPQWNNNEPSQNSFDKKLECKIEFKSKRNTLSIVFNVTFKHSNYVVIIFNNTEILMEIDHRYDEHISEAEQYETINRIGRLLPKILTE